MRKVFYTRYCGAAGAIRYGNPQPFTGFGVGSINLGSSYQSFNPPVRLFRGNVVQPLGVPSIYRTNREVIESAHGNHCKVVSMVPGFEQRVHEATEDGECCNATGHYFRTHPAEFVAEFVDRLSVCRRKDGRTPESYRRYVEWCGTMAAEAWRDWSTKNVRPEGGEYLDCGADPLMKPKRRARDRRKSTADQITRFNSCCRARSCLRRELYRSHSSSKQGPSLALDWRLAGRDRGPLPRRTADHNSARLEMPSRRPEDPLPRGL